MLLSELIQIWSGMFTGYNAYIVHTQRSSKQRERERERERDRDRERQRQTDRHRDWQRQRQAHRQRQRDDRDRERHRQTETERQTESERQYDQRERERDFSSFWNWSCATVSRTNEPGQIRWDRRDGCKMGPAATKVSRMKSWVQVLIAADSSSTACSFDQDQDWSSSPRLRKERNCRLGLRRKPCFQQNKRSNWKDNVIRC